MFAYTKKKTYLMYRFIYVYIFSLFILLQLHSSLFCCLKQNNLHVFCTIQQCIDWKNLWQKWSTYLFGTWCWNIICNTCMVTALNDITWWNICFRQFHILFYFFKQFKEIDAHRLKKNTDIRNVPELNRIFQNKLLRGGEIHGM